MASESINIAGCFKNMSDMGFTNLDCIREGGIENQLDAGATIIQIHFCKESETQSKIMFIDNGPGMTEQTLKMSRKLFDRKEASDSKNGCFGIGGSVASSQLTELAGKAIRLSKIKDGIISQITIDYPSIIKNNRYDLNSHEATKSMSDFWDKNAINKENGTIDILECPTHIVDYLILKIDNANPSLGLMYADYINSGIKITIHVNGKLHLTLVAEDISDTKNALKKESHAVDIYINPNTNSCRAYFKNGKKQDVRLGEDDKQIKEDPLKACNANSGFKHMGTIECTSTIRYRTGDKWKPEKGGYYIKRSKKLIERFPVPFTSAGDYGKRDITASSRHLWTFPTSLDKYMGIEINKSRINRDKINSVIYNTLEQLATKFSSSYWNELQASAMPIRPMPPPVLTETRVLATPITTIAPITPILAVATPVVATPIVPANTIVPSQPQVQPQTQPVQRPVAPLNPIPEQKPSHGIEILKDTNNTPYLSILHLKKMMVKVKCFGPPNLMKQEYEALLDKVGVDRFLEIIKTEGARRDSWDV